MKKEILKKLVKTNQDFGDVEIKNKKGGLIVARLTIFINNINSIEEIIKTLSSIDGMLEIKPKSKYI